MTKRDSLPRNDRGMSGVQGTNLRAEKCHQWSKEWTWGDSGSQEKLVIAHRGMTHHAGAARLKGYIVGKNHTSNIARGALKGRVLGRRRQPKLEHRNGIRKPGCPAGYERSGIGHFRGVSLPQNGKEIMHGVGVRNVGALATRDSLTPPFEGKNFG
jgi:hypothetical protein